MKAERTKNNYLFCRFHHLFEYEATYYSYLVAKVISHKLYSEGAVPKKRAGLSAHMSRGVNNMTKREVDLIFKKGGEATHHDRMCYKL